jgi:outer membrane protein assembly factor BamB
LKKTYKIITAYLLMLLTFVVPVLGSGEYVLEPAATGHNFSFRMDYWNTGTSTEDMSFPLTESWYVCFEENAQSKSQPAVINYDVIDKTTGEKVGTQQMFYVLAGDYLGAYVQKNIKKDQVEIVKKVEGINGSKEPTASHVSVDPYNLDKIYFGTLKNGVYSFNSDFYTEDNPKPLWQYKLDGKSRVTSAPLITSYEDKETGKEYGLVIFGSGAPDKSLYFIDKEYGYLWSKINFADLGEITSSPIEVNGIAGGKSFSRTFFGTNNWGMSWVYSYSIKNDETFGDQIWKFRTINGVPASMASDGQYIYFSDKTGHFYAVNTETGQTKWFQQRSVDRVAGTRIYNTPALYIDEDPVSKNIVFFTVRDDGGTGHGALYALNAENGVKIWKQPLEGEGWIAPTILQKEKAVLIADKKGYVYAFDVETGEPRNWYYDKNTGSLKSKARILNPVTGEPVSITGEISIAGGRMIFASNAGILHSYKPISLPDLAVTELDPGTTETEGGKKYTGSVTYEIKNTITDTVTAQLELTHNGYPVPGIHGKTVEFTPGEKKRYSFEFTGQAYTDSVLEAKIRPVAPVGTDINWEDNSKKVVVPAKNVVDLKVNSMYVPEFIFKGDVVYFEAKIDSNADKSISTQVVWRVNGNTIKTQNITIDPGEVRAPYIKYTLPESADDGEIWSVEVEVNPYRNSPSTEKSWANNIRRKTFEVYEDTSEDARLRPSIIVD